MSEETKTEVKPLEGPLGSTIKHTALTEKHILPADKRAPHNTVVDENPIPALKATIKRLKEELSKAEETLAKLEKPAEPNPS